MVLAIGARISSGSTSRPVRSLRGIWAVRSGIRRSWAASFCRHPPFQPVGALSVLFQNGWARPNCSFSLTVANWLCGSSTACTFRNGVNLNPGMVPDTNWKVRAVGDLNHDGHADLVWQYAPTGLVAIWFMNGSDLVSTSGVLSGAPGSDWEIFGTGDSDLDGELDLYWQNRTTGTLAVWRLLYAATFPISPLSFRRVVVGQSQRSRLARGRRVRSRSRWLARHHLSACPVRLGRGVVSEWIYGSKRTLLVSVECWRLELEIGGTALKFQCSMMNVQCSMMNSHFNIEH